MRARGSGEVRFVAAKESNVSFPCVRDAAAPCAGAMMIERHIAGHRRQTLSRLSRRSREAARFWRPLFNRLRCVPVSWTYCSEGLPPAPVTHPAPAVLY
jgi:hypothetical protein